MYRTFIKRLIDLLLSILGLPIFILILLIVAPAIYLEDKGPIFYNATRLGRNGKIFTMYKFRSMKVNAPDIRNSDGSTFSSSDDPRLTKIGKILRKSSLDETPQLLNIIVGDMSLIGPRPDLPEAIKIYKDDEIKKISVRPGITGYNQAYFRNSVDQNSKFLNDIYYVENLSFVMDLKIFWVTLINVLRRKNINIS